jgi:hypothetical protein
MRRSKVKLLSTTVIPFVVVMGVAVGGTSVTVQITGGPAYAEPVQSLRRGRVQPVQSLRRGLQSLRRGLQPVQSLRGGV